MEVRCCKEGRINKASNAVNGTRVREGIVVTTSMVQSSMNLMHRVIGGKAPSDDVPTSLATFMRRKEWSSRCQWLKGASAVDQKPLGKRERSTETHLTFSCEEVAVRPVPVVPGCTITHHRPDRIVKCAISGPGQKMTWSRTFRYEINGHRSERLDLVENFSIFGDGTDDVESTFSAR